MKKNILVNVLMNLVVGIILVAINNWMLGQGFEESFVALSAIFAIVYILANGLFYYCFIAKNK